MSLKGKTFFFFFPYLIQQISSSEQSSHQQAPLPLFAGCQHLAAVCTVLKAPGSLAHRPGFCKSHPYTVGDKTWSCHLADVENVKHLAHSPLEADTQRAHVWRARDEQMQVEKTRALGCSPICLLLAVCLARKHVALCSPSPYVGPAAQSRLQQEKGQDNLVKRALQSVFHR